MKNVQFLQKIIARHWQIFVILLMLFNLATDVLAKAHFPWSAWALGSFNAVGWVLLLGTKAPFARSISFHSVISYVATVLFGLFFFQEAITYLELLGVALGGIAIMLLV